MAAAIGGAGGKKTVFFTQTKEDGTGYIGTESKWNPGKAGHKRRKAKSHKIRTGKEAMRKCNTHKGGIKQAK